MVSERRRRADNDNGDEARDQRILKGRDPATVTYQRKCVLQPDDQAFRIGAEFQ